MEELDAKQVDIFKGCSGSMTKRGTETVEYCTAHAAAVGEKKVMVAAEK